MTGLPPGLAEALAAERLFVAGSMACETGLRLLLAPDEPGFWAHLSAAPEWLDGEPDPLDRWSKRVIEGLAARFEGVARFPFEGPPWPPFYQWALASGAFFASPVALLVHPRMGLWASLRGALEIGGAPPEAAPPPTPCAACARPCTTTCPVGAMSETGYDVPRCHEFLNTPEGETCLSFGCLARRACPPGQSYGRLASQSAWHMRHFHP